MKRALCLAGLLCVINVAVMGLVVAGARSSEPYRTQYMAWLFDGSPCTLPCWHGIIPDKTSIREAVERLAQTPGIKDIHFQNETLIFEVETPRGDLYSWIQYYYTDRTVHGIHFEVRDRAVPMAYMMFQFIAPPGLIHLRNILSTGNGAALNVLLYSGDHYRPVRLPCTPFRNVRRVSLTRDGLIFSMEIDMRQADQPSRYCLYGQPR